MFLSCLNEMSGARGNMCVVVTRLLSTRFHLIINPSNRTLSDGKKLFLWYNSRKANIIESGKTVFSVQLILQTLRKLDNGVQEA